MVDAGHHRWLFIFQTFLFSFFFPEKLCSTRQGAQCQVTKISALLSENCRCNITIALQQKSLLLCMTMEMYILNKRCLDVRTAK